MKPVQVPFPELSPARIVLPPILTVKGTLANEASISVPRKARSAPWMSNLSNVNVWRKSAGLLSFEEQEPNGSSGAFRKLAFTFKLSDVVK